MRVLHVMLSGALGGVQSAFASYTELLVHLGHDTTACVCPQAAIAPRLPKSVPIVELPNIFEHDPLAIFRAARLVRELKPDVVITHGKRALVIFAAARRFSRRHVPLVNVLHRHRFKRIEAADVSICVSKRLCDEAAAAGIDRDRLVHVPNFLPAVLPAQPARAWRDPPVIGFIGRMVPEKGTDLFIEALKILMDAGVGFLARIGGDGYLRAELMAVAQRRGLGDRISWLGWIDDVPGFYEGIDILCAPSRWESFGIVVLNAMNAGRPVVATRTAGSLEIISDGINGVLCDANPADIAAKLKSLLDDPASAKRLASQAHDDCERFTMTNVAARVQAVLDGLTRQVSRAAASGAANGAVN